MPGPVAHLLFYRQLKERLGSISELPSYDYCSIFAQGHDLLIYHNFYKLICSKQLSQNLQNSDMLQEFLFPQFVFNYLNKARKMRVLNHEQIRLFLGPGYIAHHILDAYTHPFIIYQTGDHIRDPQKKTWMHGVMENYIDILIVERLYPGRYHDKNIYKDFVFRPGELDPTLLSVLDASLAETYGLLNGGRDICQAVSQVALFMRMFKYDPTGLKRKLFDVADPLLKGTASFSFHRNSKLAYTFLNEEHLEWCNPMDDSLRSSASFFDLYNQALTEASRIIQGLCPIWKSGDFTRKDIFELVPNIASTHGLTCGTKLKIKYTKQIGR